jgi:hypothetical protein
VPSTPCTDFSVSLPANTGWPFPGVAVWQNSQGGTPWVMVSDGLQETVDYTFDPAQGFYEYIRVHDTNRAATSPPVVLPDGHTLLGTLDAKDRDKGQITYAGPNFGPVPGWTGFGPITAAPTRLYDGRLVVIERYEPVVTLSTQT